MELMKERSRVNKVMIKEKLENEKSGKQAAGKKHFFQSFGGGINLAQSYQKTGEKQTKIEEEIA